MRVIRTSFIIVFCIVGALFLAYQGVSEDPKAFTEAGVIKKYELDYDSMGVRTGRSIRVLINGDPSLNIGVKYIFVNNKWQMSIVTVSYELQILLESKE